MWGSSGLISEFRVHEAAQWHGLAKYILTRGSSRGGFRRHSPKGHFFHGIRHGGGIEAVLSQSLRENLR